MTRAQCHVHRVQANDLMSSLSRDLPMPYTNLVAWLVRLAVLLQTMKEITLHKAMHMGQANF